MKRDLRKPRGTLLQHSGFSMKGFHYVGIEKAFVATRTVAQTTRAVSGDRVARAKPASLDALPQSQVCLWNKYLKLPRSGRIVGISKQKVYGASALSKGLELFRKNDTFVVPTSPKTHPPRSRCEETPTACRNGNEFSLAFIDTATDGLGNLKSLSRGLD